MEKLKNTRETLSKLENRLSSSSLSDVANDKRPRKPPKPLIMKRSQSKDIGRFYKQKPLETVNKRDSGTPDDVRDTKILITPVVTSSDQPVTSPTTSSLTEDNPPQPIVQKPLPPTVLPLSPPSQLSTLLIQPTSDSPVCSKRPKSFVTDEVIPLPSPLDVYDDLEDIASPEREPELPTHPCPSIQRSSNQHSVLGPLSPPPPLPPVDDNDEPGQDNDFYEVVEVGGQLHIEELAGLASPLSGSNLNIVVLPPEADDTSNGNVYECADDDDEYASIGSDDDLDATSLSRPPLPPYFGRSPSMMSRDLCSLASPNKRQVPLPPTPHCHGDLDSLEKVYVVA